MHIKKRTKKTKKCSSTSTLRTRFPLKRRASIRELVNKAAADELEHKLVAGDELLRQLKQNLSVATHRMKQVANHRKRRDVSFEEGDLVFLKLQPYC